MNALRHLGRLLSELGSFARHNKAWWLVPLVVVLLLEGPVEFIARTTGRFAAVIICVAM